mgnify:CR=1 FL=1
MLLSKKHGVNPSLNLCAWCNKPKGIVMHGLLPHDEEAPKECITDVEPCPDCQERMNKGITVIECDDNDVFTGRWIVVSEHACKALFPDNFDAIISVRRCAISKEFMDWILKQISDHMRPEVQA